ncbi:5-formyltetrahydrofolate cyclo-ligase [Tritonibacter mobilis]|uniref:5-formyltetrahydrofolate cyclo-ligase n=1 Tax=Tritonibacter mobilis TaxID=379347 RepID=UPI0009BD1BAD
MPVLPTDAPKRTPNIRLAPCAGRSADGYRLGQGGGYFDRALANLTPAPHAIGIWLLQSRMATIHPSRMT